jgi:hypothetical protein
MQNPLQHIQRLQGWRGRKGRDLSIAQVLESEVDQAAKTHKRLGELIDLWRDIVPEALASHTRLTGFRNGVLQVKVDSSSILFEIDRLLRGGAESELRRQFRGSLSRVNARIGPLDEPASAFSRGSAPAKAETQSARRLDHPDRSGTRGKTIAGRRRAR